jgi:succinoglycan biosynthesis protein ExoM
VSTSGPLVSVCVCTFRRPELLAALLNELNIQRTDGLFTYEIVVADNDAARSAEQAIRSFELRASVPVSYCVEPVPNIARARNAAVANATGSFIAFVDDDELPQVDWLLTMFRTITTHQVAGVLGPVVARFEQQPAPWISKGRFFDRPRYATGRRITWPEARTGNALVSRAAFEGLEPPFRPEFATAGEDMDFFRRAADNGCAFVWCDEAPVSELVARHRCTRRFLLRRALLRGSNFPKHPEHRVRNMLKSLLAVPCYTLALPLFALAGHHWVMAYAVKLADHSSRLLAFAGLPLMREREN